MTDKPGRHSPHGRIGRGTKPPPQLGQTLRRISLTHVSQKVHSYVHIIAVVLAGGKSVSHISQFGRSSSAIEGPLLLVSLRWTSYASSSGLIPKRHRVIRAHLRFMKTRV